VLTELRQRSSKSSGGFGRHGGGAIEDGGDVRRVAGDAYGVRYLRAVWWVEAKNHRWTVFGFGPQNSGAVSAGIGGGTWHHYETCVEAKLSHEGRVAVGSTEIELDHNALGLGGSL
jgi:hypothetical protein